MGDLSAGPRRAADRMACVAIRVDCRVGGAAEAGVPHQAVTVM